MTSRFLIAACLVLALTSRASAQGTTVGTLAVVDDAVTISLITVPTLTVQISGTWVGAPVFEASVDGGVIWWPLTVIDQSNGAEVQRAQNNGRYLVLNTGYTAARVRAQAIGSGTVTVTATRGYVTVAPATMLKVLGPTGAVLPANGHSNGNNGWTLPPCNPVRRVNCR